jgi:SAM-dependent methyltransferase
MDIDLKMFTGMGKRIEMGAGVSFMKKLYPDVIITDIKKADHLDGVFDAQNMNVENESVRALYGINCFHHFPEPEIFFNELDRVLVKGGGCILLDPYYGPLAVFLYKKLFKTETFDKTQKEWSSSGGAMVGANQALSYIVFVRDREIFNSRFPNLQIVHSEVMNNYLQYLISGGLNFKQLLPDFFFPIIKFVEFLLIPVSTLFGLHHIIVIRKTD